MPVAEFCLASYYDNPASSSSTPVHLGDNAHERRAEHHGDNTQPSLRNRLISHGGTGASASRTRSRRGTSGGSLGSSRSSGRGRVTALVAEDGVCAALLLEAFGQLVDSLLLGQAVDAAVVLVFDGGVALAAGVEGAGNVTRDWGTAGCVGDVGEDVDVAGAVGEGGHCSGDRRGRESKRNVNVVSGRFVVDGGVGGGRRGEKVRKMPVNKAAGPAHK